MAGSHFTKPVVALLFMSLGIFSCGTKSADESHTNTIVGRGGAFFDRRVQVINALPNTLDRTTCLYLSEYRSKDVPKFSKDSALNAEQTAFLQKAEREAKPMTPYPVSVDALDKGLAEKEILRRLRGGILIPLGVGAGFIGFGVIAVALAPLCPTCFWGGMTIGQVLTNPFAQPFIGLGLGGLGLLDQASRDLASKNKDVRSDDAVADATKQPENTNLGVTLAFMNLAQSLPAASSQRCPANLTKEEVIPFAQIAVERFVALRESDQLKKVEDAKQALETAQGCHFSVAVDDGKIIYQAVPLSHDLSSIRLQTYSIRRAAGARLIADEELKLQLKSDAGGFRKYIAENDRGSIALWISPVDNGGSAAAKLSHRLPSGEYAGQQSQIGGKCRL